MTGVVLTLASAGVMCVAGVGVSTAFKWFHNFDLDMSKKKPKDIDHPHTDSLKDLRKKARI